MLHFCNEVLPIFLNEIVVFGILWRREGLLILVLTPSFSICMTYQQLRAIFVFFSGRAVLLKSSRI